MIDAEKKSVDTLELLKNKPQVKVIMSTFDEEWYGTVLDCSACGCRWMMANDDDTHYCPKCGSEVRW